MNDKKDNFLLAALWVFPALVPLVMVLTGFFLQGWYWGLMDDHSIISIGNNAWEVFVEYFSGLCGWGVFRPTFAAHAALAYSVFRDSPGLFYIVKWVEVLMALCVWGTLAYRLTGRWISLFLSISVALSFHFLYDAFFFLSTQEILGLFFCGLALHLFVSTLWTLKRTWQIVSGLLGMLLLLTGFGAKEPFIACGVAFGLAAIVFGLWMRESRKPALVLGATVLIVSLAYGAAVKSFIHGSYTSGYSLTNFSRIGGNIVAWANKDLLNHGPWILASVVVLGYFRRRYPTVRIGSLFSFKERFGLLLGACLYLMFLFILLPWSPTTYYAGPLGVFFAFFIAMLLTGLLVRLGPKASFILVLGGLCFNILISARAMTNAMSYQNDTAQLMKWVKDDRQFRRDIENGWSVSSNACEPAVAIPRLANRLYGTVFKSFTYTQRIEDVPGDPRGQYYLYGRWFGDQAALGQSEEWSVVFQSKNWVMYQREKN